MTINEETIKDAIKKLPEQAKDNKFALIGGVIGYLLSDNKEAVATITGVVAGALVDKKDK